MTGKLCDVPVQPLSRSLPLPSSGCAGSSSGTVRTRDFWPAAQVDGGGPRLGRQRTSSVSLNRGFPRMSSRSARDGPKTVPCFLVRSATAAVPGAPQFGLPTTGGTKPIALAMPWPNLSSVSGCGTQPPAGVSTHAETATWQT